MVAPAGKSAAKVQRAQRSNAQYISTRSEPAGGCELMAGRSLTYDSKNALNAICPYFTMFPLEYPHRVLSRYKRVAPTVMDPFCGRGTTLYAARMLGFPARGIDASPVAVAIAKAKLCSVSMRGVLALAESYIVNFPSPAGPRSEFFRRAFDGRTLRQVCAVRQGLLADGDKSERLVVLRALMLGALHGPTAKSLGEQAYLSNQMPRTFSTKPDYSIKYWRKHRLQAPPVEVIDVLDRRLRRIGDASVSARYDHRQVRLADSTEAGSIPPTYRDFSVVVTSPPYFGMRTYVEDQWLRTWFLGGPARPAYGNPIQLEHTGPVIFAESLGAVWRNLARSRTDDLHLYVRFGVIPSSAVNPKKLIFESLEASETEWTVKAVRPANTAEAGKRQAVHMAAASKAVAEYDFCIVRT